MTPKPAAPPQNSANAALRLQVLRVFFAGIGLLSAMAALACLFLDTAHPLEMRLPVILAYALLSVAGGVAYRLRPDTARKAMPVLALASLVVIALAALVSGDGLGASGLVYFALVACMAWAMAPRSVAQLVTGVAVVLVSALGITELTDLLHLNRPAGLASSLAQVVAQWAAVAAGSGGGAAFARLLARHDAAAVLREQRFQSLLGIAAAGYWETDAALRLRRVSYRASDGLFKPLASVQGRTPWSISALLFHGDALDAVRADMEGREVLRDLPCAWQHSDGSVRRFLVSGQPRHDSQGRFLGYWGVARDVSAEHRAREALRATERRYHELFVRLPTALVLHRRGRILDANPAAAQLLGYPSVGRMLGHDLLAEHLDDDERATALQRVMQLERLPLGESLPSAAYRMQATDGREIHVRSVGTRADSDGVPAMLSILIDETASMAAVSAQQRAEALFSQVLSTSPDVITLTDADSGDYLMVNEAFCQVLGYDADEVVGKSAVSLGIWHRLAERDALMQLLAERGSVQNATVEFVSKHGQVVPLLVSATLFERDGRQRLVINARDVTDVARLRLEREAILANASVGIAFTRGGHFEMVNPQFERIYGWAAGTLVGQPTRVVWASDEETAALGEELAPVLGLGDAAELERTGTRHDGSQFLVRLRAKALDPLHPAENGTIWIAEDVTRQRQDETALARARDAAEAANHAKSTFLANTSHEIRTPLNGLLGLARLARQPGTSPQSQRNYLDRIAESAETLSMIISDILDLSKIEAGKLEVESSPFDLRDLLHTLQQAYAALAAGHGLAFSVEIDRALPARVRGDALRVRQVLSNFLNNALKFTSAGSIRLVVQWRSGHVVRFEVHDTGPGIDAATQARLFKPFTQGDDSTSRRYGGTGLGLSICRELATLMGGAVGLNSSTGRGSCFFAELPLPPAPPDLRPAPDTSADDALLSGARVLLAEDNQINMMIATELLKQWGVQVVPVTDGLQVQPALTRAALASQPVQAVLMDVQMPGLSGYDCTRALRQQYGSAELPVIALTAAALVSERERAVAAGMNDFVTKPIDPQRLRNALVRVLTAARDAASRPA